MKKPAKKNDQELWDLIANAISKNNYLFVNHAQDRLKERSITDIEVLDILENKKHCARKRNNEKDKYIDDYHDWNYCIEGLDLNGQEIRIIISFSSKLLLIITVIRLNNRSKFNA